MRNSLFALLLLLVLPLAAQEKVTLYDDMCDPLQAVFCDYVRECSQTNRIANAGGEYVGTLIGHKFYGWGLFVSSSGIRSYGQYRDGKLLFGLLINSDVARVGSDGHYVMYDLVTGGIMLLFGEQLISLYVPQNVEALKPGMDKLVVLACTYILTYHRHCRILNSLGNFIDYIINTHTYTKSR